MSEMGKIKLNQDGPLTTRATLFSSLADERRVSFGRLDRLGRDVGVLISYYDDVIFTLAGPDARSGYLIPAGTYQGVCLQATRNGFPYGATQGAVFFDTAEERESHVAKYLKAR